MMETAQIKQLNQRRIAMVNRQSSWLTHWDELSRLILPRNSRIVSRTGQNDSNSGQKRHNDIIDGTGTKAARVCAAGMMSGLTSPSRPWFVLTVPDKQLAKYKPVKIWLNEVTSIIEGVLAKSNVYRALYTSYEDLTVFGTHASFMSDNYKDVIRMNTFAIGEYSLSANYDGIVDSIYIDRWFPTHAIVKNFGLENCSTQIQRAFRQGHLEQMWMISQVVEPREDRDLKSRAAKNMPFKSVWYDPISPDKVLRESGYKSFPGVTPRWGVTSTDVYGMAPSMDALGDIKQLQHEQTRKAQAIDFMSNPPMQLPISMKNQESKILPGAKLYYDNVTGTNGARNLFEVKLDINALVMDINETRNRIKEHLFNDIFLMIVQKTTQMTATEVAERHEEKLLMLGPVVERISNEMLDPIIETVFERLAVAGLLPPAPPEMQGMPLSVDYVSIIAQAQKAVGVNTVDRFTMGIMNIAQMKPDVLDKFDADTWADVYADDLGIDPSLIIAGPEVAIVRQQRAQQQQQAMQQQAMLTASQAAANVGGIPAGSPAIDALNKMKAEQ